MADILVAHPLVVPRRRLRELGGDPESLAAPVHLSAQTSSEPMSS
jgi:hypothetical protein